MSIQRTTVTPRLPKSWRRRRQRPKPSVRARARRRRTMVNRCRSGSGSSRCGRRVLEDESMLLGRAGTGTGSARRPLRATNTTATTDAWRSRRRSTGGGTTAASGSTAYASRARRRFSERRITPTERRGRRVGRAGTTTTASRTRTRWRERALGRSPRVRRAMFGSSMR